MYKLFLKWFDNQAVPVRDDAGVDWLRVIPFLLIHLSCLLVFWVGVSWFAILTALALFWLRIFAIGAFYHRYFSHRAFRTHRIWQMVFAILGASAAQRGPLWWAAHHRQHHKVADTDADVHSPVTQSFWQSHVGWFLSYRHFHYNDERVKDWQRFPELCWLDRFDAIVPLGLMLSLFLLGSILGHYVPSLHTSGLQLVIWGFCISTVMLLHSTVSINSLAHKYGRRRYNNKDESRNNFWLALLTFGEGWHNNHHRYPAAARQGFYWWEVDITFYLLKLMQKLSIIDDLRDVPKSIRDKHD